jgi:hypothetical protein
LGESSSSALPSVQPSTLSNAAQQEQQQAQLEQPTDNAGSSGLNDKNYSQMESPALWDVYRKKFELIKKTKK